MRSVYSSAARRPWVGTGSRLPLPSYLLPFVEKKTRQHMQQRRTSRRKKFWRDADVCDSVSDNYKTALERLLKLDHDGDGSPLTVIPSRKAKIRYETFYDENAERQLKAAGPFGYALSKLEETPARIALLVHLVRCVIGDGDQSTLDDQSMIAGIRIAEWFIQETERIYEELGMDGGPPDETSDLAELISVNGGEVTARELRGFAARYRPAGAADLALESLRKKGLGKFCTVQTGGRPKTVFQLYQFNGQSIGSEQYTVTKEDDEEWRP